MLNRLVLTSFRLKTVAAKSSDIQAGSIYRRVRYNDISVIARGTRIGELVDYEIKKLTAIFVNFLYIYIYVTDIVFKSFKFYLHSDRRQRNRQKPRMNMDPTVTILSSNTLGPFSRKLRN